VALSGSGALVKNGTGRLDIGGNNTGFTGQVTVNDGILFYGDNAGALGTGNIEITGGVIVARWNGGINRTLGTGAGQIQITGGVSGLSGSGGGTGAVTHNLGAITWGNATFNPTQFVFQSSISGANNATLSSAINLNGDDVGATPDINGVVWRTIRSDQAATSTGTGTFSGAITNSGVTNAAGLIKTGTGLHVLSGNNTYNGGTSIDGGTLRFATRNSMPATGNVTVNDGAAIGVNLGTVATVWSTGTSGEGTLGGLLAGDGGQIGSTVTYNGNVGLNLEVVANVTYSGNIANVGDSLALIKTGTSALTLDGNNTYSGGTTLRGGTLNIGSSTALGTGGLVFIGAGTTLNNTSGSAITLASTPSTWTGNFTFTGTDDLHLGNGAITSTVTGNAGVQITVNGGKLTVGGQMTLPNTNGFVKAGAGTLSLLDQANATSTWIGITGGVLEVAKLANGGAASSIGTSGAQNSNLNINSATLRYIGTGDSTNRQFRTSTNLGNGGFVTLDASGTGAINFTSTTNFGNANTNQTRTLNLIGSNTDNNTFAANLTNNGTGALTVSKDGTGTWVLTGNSTYSGGTNVLGGTLLVNNSAGSGTGSGTVTVSSGSTLGGSGTIAGNTTIAGIHSPGNSPGIQTFDADLTYEAGASVLWELVNNVAHLGTRGTDFDGINVGGTLTFGDLTTIDLSFNFTGSLVDWSNAFWATAHTGTDGWLIYSGATDLVGFDNLSINTSNWLDGFGQSFDSIRGGDFFFSLYQDGNDIFLNYNVIPEPKTALLGAIGFLMLLRRRR